MGLFSFLSKNKQGGAGGEGEFYSRAEDDGRPRARNTRKSPKAGKQGKAGGRVAGGDDEPLDPVLPEKKRARRRLVGAVALVLAMIIGLPMILDSEPKPMADDISIQIPSRDKPPAASPATSAPVSAPAAATAAGTSAVPLAASLDPHEQIVVMPPASATSTGARAPAASSPAPDAAAKKPESKPDLRPQEPAHAAVADKPDAKADAKPAEKATEKPGDKQVAKLEHKTDQKDEARAAAILEGKDADAKQAADKQAADKQGGDKKAGKFIVQVAALTSQEKITELQGKLSDAGFKPMLQTVPTDAGVTTRVRVGPFASKDEAQSALTKLDKLGLHGKLLPL
jgi:DedD protein